MKGKEAKAKEVIKLPKIKLVLRDRAKSSSWFHKGSFIQKSDFLNTDRWPNMYYVSGRKKGRVCEYVLNHDLVQAMEGRKR